MVAASTEDWAVIQLCGFVLSMKTGTNLKLITLLLQHNTFNSQSLTSFAPSGLGLARVMVYIMMLPVNTINQFQKNNKKNLQKKKKKKKKGKMRAAIEIIRLFLKLTIHKVPVN